MLTAIYIRILTNEAYFVSQNDNIHLLALVKTSVFKVYKNIVFHFIAQDFNRLKNEGLHGIYDYNVDLGYISLDSKEASSLLGLKQSFTHDFCCRRCYTTRNNFSSVFFEHQAILRSDQSFMENFYSINDSQNSYKGIQNLSHLRYFNVDNINIRTPFCILHDVFEGVCLKIFNFFI